METPIDAVVVTSVNAGADTIQIYDGTTGTHLKSYRGVPAAPSTFCSVGLADYLMTAQRDKPFLQAWTIHRHEALQIRLVLPGKVNAMAVSPTGPKYCVIGISEKVYIYKLLSGRLYGVASRHYQPITRLLFTPCGNYFASAGEDGFVYLWNLASFIDALHQQDAPQIQPHFILGQHSDKVTDLAITSSGIRGFLISSSLDHTARVFDLTTGRQLYNLITSSEVTSITCNSLGSQVFLGHKDGTVNIVNLLPHPQPGDVQVTKRGAECHQKAVRCLAVTASGNRLITGGDDGDVKVWTVTGFAMGAIRSAKDSSKYVALQRIIHTGRGPITNLSVMRINREVLSATERELQEVIAPFSQDQSLPLTAPVTVPVRGRGNDLSHLLDIYNFKKETGPVVVEGYSKNENVEPDSNLQSTIDQLKTANSQLFKFALKHIVQDKKLM